MCRYGGEEFVLVLPQMTVPATLERAAEIRVMVRQLSVAYRDTPIGPVTVSSGVSSFPDDGQTISSLLEAADEALYRARNKGRDRVELAGGRRGDVGGPPAYGRMGE